MSNSKGKKLLDRVREYMRLKHYSIHTERTYCDWIKRYIAFHQMTSIDDMKNGEKKIEDFLTWLAVENSVAPSTQNQAMNSLIFLYKNILKTPLTGQINAVRSRKKVNVPVVLTREEVRVIINTMNGIPQVITKLLYGCGIRIKDICAYLQAQFCHPSSGKADRHSDDSSFAWA